MVSYLDDFSLIEDSEEECWSAQHVMIELLIGLSFAIKWEKLVGLANRVQFSGLIGDSVKRCLELPIDKLQMLSQLASAYLVKQKLSRRKELEVFMGHYMAFAAKAIYGARTFSRIFIDALCSSKESHHRIRLTKLIRLELTWWRDLARNFNGSCLCEMGKVWPVLSISTDASFSGFGAVCRDLWFTGTWSHDREIFLLFRSHCIPSPTLHTSLANDIIFLELVAACLPLFVLAPHFAGHKVMVLSDNTQTVSF